MKQYKHSKKQADSSYTEALAMIKRQEFTQAAERLEQLRVLDPRNLEIYLQLAGCYEALGRMYKAIQVVLEALMLDPYNMPAARLLKDLHLKHTGDFPHIPFNQTEAPATWPSICLCMIVKNEEENLAACLDFVKELVNEIVIVDTGSTDRTVEIAQSYGARVEYFAWEDDFATARNETLKYASKEWLLVLDADDRVDELNVLRLKWAVVLAQADAYICETLSYHEGGKEDNRSGFIRLFRNVPGLVYESPLHENFVRSARSLELTIATTNIQIQHWGYSTGEEDMHKRYERNLRVLTKAVEKNPDDLFSRAIRGLLLVTLDREEEAIPELETLLTMLGDRFINPTYMARVYVLLLNYYSRTLQLEKLRQVLEKSLVDMVLVRSFWVNAGYCMLTPLGDGPRALQILHRAATLPVSDADQIYFDDKAKKTLLSEAFLAKLLVRAYLLTQDLKLARKTYQEQLVKPVAGAEFASKSKLEQAEQLLRSQQHMEAVKLLSPVHPKDAAALRLLGLAEAMLEGWALAADHFTAAVVVGGVRPGDWSSLAVCELRAENVGLARGYARLALKENPQDTSALEVLHKVAA